MFLEVVHLYNFFGLLTFVILVKNDRKNVKERNFAHCYVVELRKL